MLWSVIACRCTTTMSANLLFYQLQVMNGTASRLNFFPEGFIYSWLHLYIYFNSFLVYSIVLHCLHIELTYYTSVPFLVS